MFQDAALQVVRYSCVKNLIVLVSQYINAILVSLNHGYNQIRRSLRLSSTCHCEIVRCFVTADAGKQSQGLLRRYSPRNDRLRVTASLSEYLSDAAKKSHGLLRRYAPRNDRLRITASVHREPVSAAGSVADPPGFTSDRIESRSRRSPANSGIPFLSVKNRGRILRLLFRRIHRPGCSGISTVRPASAPASSSSASIPFG